MKTNKNLKITKKANGLLSPDGDSAKNVKVHKDKSAKRRLSIYDDFSDENLDDPDFKYDDENFDEE